MTLTPKQMLWTGGGIALTGVVLTAYMIVMTAAPYCSGNKMLLFQTALPLHAKGMAYSLEPPAGCRVITVHEVPSGLGRGAGGVDTKAMAC